MLWPAILVEFLVSQSKSGKSLDLRLARALAFWVFIALATCLAVMCAADATNYQQLFGTHFMPAPLLSSDLPKPTDYGFLWRILRFQEVAIVIGLAGIFISARHNEIAKIALPGIFLITVLVAHSLHRPIWDYYYLHLAIPMAWLGGRSLAWLLRTTLGHASDLRRKWSFSKGAICTAGLGLLMILMVHVQVRLQATFDAFSRLPTLDRSVEIKMLLTKQPSHEWVFSDPVIYAFHASMLVPPELAVLSLKRFWSGQMTRGKVLEIIKKYQPFALIVPKRELTLEWKEYVAAQYTLLYENDKQAIYRRKDSP